MRKTILMGAICICVALTGCTKKTSELTSTQKKTDTSVPQSSIQMDEKNQEAGKETSGEIFDALRVEYEKSYELLQEDVQMLREEIKNYDSYKLYKDEIPALYENVLTMQDELYDLTNEACREYYYRLVEELGTEDRMALYDGVEPVFDEVYDSILSDQFDEIYDDFFSAMFDQYYDGILKDAYDDGVDYSEWYDVRSEAYEVWSDARSDFYDKWSDERSEVYEKWSDIRSEFYKGNFDVDEVMNKVNRYSGESDAEKAAEQSSNENQDSTSTENAENTKLKNGNVKDTLNAYEAFIDEYVKFMQNYDESDDPLAMMDDYLKMLEKYEKFQSEIDQMNEDNMTTEDWAYYIEVLTRCNQKIASLS